MTRAAMMSIILVKTSMTATRYAYFIRSYLLQEALCYIILILIG